MHIYIHIYTYMHIYVYIYMDVRNEMLSNQQLQHEYDVQMWRQNQIHRQMHPQCTHMQQQQKEQVREKECNFWELDRRRAPQLQYQGSLQSRLYNLCSLWSVLALFLSIACTRARSLSFSRSLCIRLYVRDRVLLFLSVLAFVRRANTQTHTRARARAHTHTHAHTYTHTHTHWCQWCRDAATNTLCSCTRHLMWIMTHSYVWHDSFIYVTWPTGGSDAGMLPQTHCAAAHVI